MDKVSSFYTLKQGERFKALVTDIKQGQITIRLDDGGAFTARAKTLPETRIGEESVFAVKENDQKGHIVLEIIKPDLSAKQNNMARDALRNAGLFASEDNMALSKTLFMHNLPVDAATLQKAAFFRYAAPNMTPEMVVFLLSENIAPVMENAVQFIELINEPMLLYRQLTELKKLPNRAAPPFLRLDAPARGRGNPLNEYYNGLLAYANKTLESAFASKPSNAVLKQARKIKEILRFLEQFGSRRAYYQIPFVFDRPPVTRQAELFVFNEKEREQPNAASALIALDTSALGRTEVFIQKTERAVSLQFTATPETLELFKREAVKLTQSLNTRGFTIPSVLYKRLEERFTLLTPTPGEEETKRPQTPARFTFDMRV